MTSLRLAESSGEKSNPESEAVAVLDYSLMEHCPALDNILLPAIASSD